MAQRIELSTTQKQVRDFIRNLGDFREPIELVLAGTLVAKIVPPSELSDADKKLILDDGWAVVEKARDRTRRIATSVLQHEVDEAVREVRAGRAQRRR